MLLLSDSVVSIDDGTFSWGEEDRIPLKKWVTRFFLDTRAIDTHFTDN